MRLGRKFWTAAVAVMVLSGCGDGGRDEAADSLSDPATTAPTTTIDIRSRQVPDHPDVAYVEAVVKHLEAVRGDVRREVYATQSMSQATYDRLADIYNGEQLDISQKIWSKASMEEHPDAIVHPGDARYLNFEILDTRPGCVVYIAESDNSTIMKSPTLPFPKFVFEIRTFEGDHRSNETPWKYEHENSFRPERLEGYKCGAE
jgi:hypothetical protein